MPEPKFKFLLCDWDKHTYSEENGVGESGFGKTVANLMNKGYVLVDAGHQPTGYSWAMLVKAGCHVKSPDREHLMKEIAEGFGRG